MAAVSPGAGAMRLLAWLRARTADHAAATMREIRAGLDLPKTTALIYVMQLEAAGHVVRFGPRKRLIGLAGDPRIGGTEAARQAAVKAALEHHDRVRRQARTRAEPIVVRRTRDAPATRPCLGCRRPFESEGWHNRLCTPCRGHAAAMI